VIAAVDRAMYRSKKSRRGRTTWRDGVQNRLGVFDSAGVRSDNLRRPDGGTRQGVGGLHKRRSRHRSTHTAVFDMLRSGGKADGPSAGWRSS
jgi:hypothetical protein